jgi:hypothetical protein
VSDHGAPFFQRSIVAYKLKAPGHQHRILEVRWAGGRVIPWSGPVLPGERIVEAQLSCLHWHTYRRPRPPRSTPKSAPCSACGSGRRRNAVGKDHAGFRQVGEEADAGVQAPSRPDLVAQEHRVHEAIVEAAHDSVCAQLLTCFVITALEARTLRPTATSSPGYAEQVFERLDVQAKRLDLLPSFDPTEDLPSRHGRGR